MPSSDIELSDENNDPVEARNAYSREFKIGVLDWYHKNGSSKHKTAQHFKISRTNVRRWVDAECKIRDAKKGVKSIGSGRSAMYPLLERRLHEEFLELRNKQNV